jgi:hypothetical protein
MSSLDNSPARGFFHDLHSFKDFIAVVIVCAPDQFLHEDCRAHDDQLNLERAFGGLRYGLQLTAQEKGESELLTTCRELVEAAYEEYRAGRDRQGQSKLEEMEKLIKKLPSQ